MKPSQVDALGTLGKNIRESRLEHGWSQEQLAAITGLHRTYIGGIERGERNVSFENLLQISRALDTTPGNLVAGIH